MMFVCCSKLKSKRDNQAYFCCSAFGGIRAENIRRTNLLAMKMWIKKRNPINLTEYMQKTHWVACNGKGLRYSSNRVKISLRQIFLGNILLVVYEFLQNTKMADWVSWIGKDGTAAKQFWKHNYTELLFTQISESYIFLLAKGIIRIEESISRVVSHPTGWSLVFILAPSRQQRNKVK